MKKEYITYMTHLKSDNPMDDTFLRECMNVILNYTTKRFVDLRKKNQLGTYDKKQCDNYSKTQTFIINNKEKSLLDARYSRAIDISIHAKCASLLECKQDELEAKLLKQETIFTKFTKAARKLSQIRGIKLK